jgi:hypothetical protein
MLLLPSGVKTVFYSTLLHLRPSYSTKSEDAGIEPRTVATSALTVRRSKPLGYTVDLIHKMKKI